MATGSKPVTNGQLLKVLAELRGELGWIGKLCHQDRDRTETIGRPLAIEQREDLAAFRPRRSPRDSAHVAAVAILRSPSGFLLPSEDPEPGT